MILDPAREPWMLDHAPTWTVPALPMTSMLDRLARAAEAALGAPVAAIEGAQVHRWLTLPGPTRTRTEVRPISSVEADVTLLAWREAPTAALSRFEKVASARVRVGAAEPRPAPLSPLVDATARPAPYAGHETFQGPRFQCMRTWRLGRDGASTTLDPTPTAVPVGALHPALLDASLHGIPADASIFSPDLAPELAPLPYRVPSLRVFGPAPTAGEVRCEIRFRGAGEGARFPEFLLQLTHEGRVWMEWVITMIGLPKGSIGMAPGPERRAFLHERRFVPGVRLSKSEAGREGAATTLTREQVQEIAWLPGTVEAVYGTADVTQIAVREHLAHRLGVHPSTVAWDGAEASTVHEPIARYPLRVEAGESLVRVTDAGPQRQDLERRRHLVAELAGPRHARGGGSLLRPGAPVRRARRDRRSRGLRRPARQAGALPGEPPGHGGVAALRGPPRPARRRAQPRPRQDRAQGELDRPHRGRRRPAGPARAIRSSSSTSTAPTRPRSPASSSASPDGCSPRRQSLLVHVEGTRSLACGQPVLKMSSVIIDMAIHARAAIVPVRFAGGLPRETMAERLDFPLGFGRQDHWIGKPILPEALEAMPYGERRAAVVGAINATGPAVAEEQPNPGDPEMAGAVAEWVARTGAETAHAAILMALARERELQPAWQRVLSGMRSGTLVVEDTAEDRAVAGIAKWLYGPRGPKIVVG